MNLPAILILAAEAAAFQNMVPRSNNLGWVYLSYSSNTKADQGSTFFKLIVGRDGKPEQCVVLLSTQNAALDKAVCIHAMKFRYKPARDDKGQPTYGVAEKMINFSRGRGGTIFIQEPDYIVHLETVPEDLPPKSYVNVTVLVDEEGRLKGCDPGPPVKDRGKLNDFITQLQTLSCKELFTVWDPLVETNLAKERISYVRTISVGFQRYAGSPIPPK